MKAADAGASLIQGGGCSLGTGNPETKREGQRRSPLLGLMTAPLPFLLPLLSSPPLQRGVTWPGHVCLLVSSCTSQGLMGVSCDGNGTS